MTKLIITTVMVMRQSFATSLFVVFSPILRHIIRWATSHRVGNHPSTISLSFAVSSFRLPPICASCPSPIAIWGRHQWGHSPRRFSDTRKDAGKTLPFVPERIGQFNEASLCMDELARPQEQGMSIESSFGTVRSYLILTPA